ncbi:MAG: hypothetical protein ACR2FH_02945 [Caulobacteraceae bacterium]
MTHHWLVAGVGRSGTTAIYEALQALARRQGRFRHFYEPYLWGPPTWGPRFRRVAKAFASTNAIDARGLAVHLSTPLFASERPERSGVHADFVHDLFRDGRSSLAKIIRGCGRMADYLELRPGVKVVVVMRTPLDCVNSILGNFSFFWDEFHPSDRPRFRRELETLGRPQGAFASEGEAAAAWWREMNGAALRTLEAHRDRVFVAPHEAFAADRALTSRRLARFLSVEAGAEEVESLAKPVGQITRKINLRADDRDRIAPLQKAYFETIERLSDIPMGGARLAAARRIEAKYQDLAPGAFAPETARDASPLRVRALLSREREGRRDAADAISRAAEELDRAAAALSQRRRASREGEPRRP